LQYAQLVCPGMLCVVCCVPNRLLRGAL